MPVNSIGLSEGGYSDVTLIPRFLFSAAADIGTKGTDESSWFGTSASLGFLLLFSEEPPVPSENGVLTSLEASAVDEPPRDQIRRYALLIRSYGCWKSMLRRRGAQGGRLAAQTPSQSSASAQKVGLKILSTSGVWSSGGGVYAKLRRPTG